MRSLARLLDDCYQINRSLQLTREHAMVKSSYWQGTPPSDAKRWQGADSGEILADRYTESLFRMYRRYVRRWNEIELDKARSLSEHTHEVFGARVIGAQRMFVLHCDINRDDGWILEMRFARGFQEFHPGWSCGRNALRTTTDILRSVLHWRGKGRAGFDDWLARDALEHGPLQEWTEYNA